VRGRTIIFSIHQPRFAIFKLFDRLSLLAAGRTVYHGKAAKALAFFESIGIILKQVAKVTVAAGRITAAAHIAPSYLSGRANVHPRGFLIARNCMPHLDRFSRFCTARARSWPTHIQASGVTNGGRRGRAAASGCTRRGGAKLFHQNTS